MSAAAAREAPLPWHALRERFRRWITTRTVRVPGPWRVRRQRVYIVPTRLGFGYAVLLFAMLLGSMNYSNSMAFALTFLLTAIGGLAMHYTHGNLVNVELRRLPAEPVHAGDTARFRFELANPSKLARYALLPAWQDGEPGDSIDVPAGGSAVLELPWPADRRGWLPAPRFSVTTEFPLGLFHAWTWVELDAAALVYPRLAPPGVAPPAGGTGHGETAGGGSGDDEFSGLRPYRPGDALRAIHWKSLARSREPLVKQFSATAAPELWLDWQRLPPFWDTETRLSQLARWIVDAEAARQPYGLRLPGTEFPPALGAAHCHGCLSALAGYGDGGGSGGGGGA